MNTNQNPAVTGYLVLFRGAKDWDKGLSDEQLGQMMNRLMQWFDGIYKTGKVKGGQPLAQEGAVITRGRDGTMISDGPFAESKEAIGGYVYLQVNTFEEAVAIAKTCPSLDCGAAIEVRPVLSECPVFERVKQRLGNGFDFKCTPDQ